MYLRTTSHVLTGVKLYAVVTTRTASLTFTNPTFCPHSVFMCFVWISEQTAIISLYSINRLVFINEMVCVYCAVRADSLYCSRSTPREICNGQSGTGTRFSPSSSVYRQQYHSTIAALGQTGNLPTNSARPDTGERWTEKYLHITFRRESLKFNHTCTQHYSQY